VRLAIVNLTGGGLSGGYLNYLRKLVPRLQSSPKIEMLAVFAPETAAPRLHDQNWPIHAWPAADVRWGYPRLKRMLRDLRPDVVFIPTANWLHVGETPVVVMLRNMEPLEIPFGGNSPGETARNLLRRAAARRACIRASRVIAVSDHVRDFLVRRWRLAADAVPVVYHGVDAPTAWREPVVPRELRQQAPGEFLFSAGSIRPARGLLDLVEALPQLCALNPRLSAVIAGAADRGTGGYYRSLIARGRQLGIDSRLVWTGPLSEAEMRWCYERCTAFVMTSRAEACPNIALEAMCHGCACVSVEHAPMPEFFADAALYYRAGDPAGLAASLERVLTEPDIVRTLKQAATLRSHAFDWETTARRTVAELEAAASGCGAPSATSAHQRSSG
jgi:glycosyltransferase involved in cell wall biosynthesis